MFKLLLKLSLFLTFSFNKNQRTEDFLMLPNAVYQSGSNYLTSYPLIDKIAQEFFLIFQFPEIIQSYTDFIRPLG